MKDEMNWESYLDNYFELFRPLIKKNEYEDGLTICYTKSNIYVWCDLSIDRFIIKKLEFGRLTADEQGKEQTNWIKGVFINNEHFYTKFLQTSFDGEYFDKTNNYTLEFTNMNKNVIARFLNTPCVTGWTEKEYLLDNDTYYKVVVVLGNYKWTIKLQNIEEQDIPLLTDIIDIWLRVKIADSFWNNKRRSVKEIIVKPMND